MPININLNHDQGGPRVIALTEDQLASIHQQENAMPIPPGGSVPRYVVPAACAGRAVILTPVSWQDSGKRYLSGSALSDGNVWVMPFTPAAFTAAGCAGGEWIDQPAFRLVQVLRNRDSAVIYSGPATGVQTPSLNFVPTPPAPHSGKVQLVAGEAYTLAVWNAPGQTPGRMFMGFYLQ